MVILNLSWDTCCGFACRNTELDLFFIFFYYSQYIRLDYVLCFSIQD